MKLHRFEVLESTSDHARRLADEGAPAGTAVLARRQTKGRGQWGRSWDSPEGGLYASVIVRPSILVRDAAFVTLAAAVALHDAIGGDVGIKWPNDLLARDSRRKIAGLLVDTAALGERLDFAVVGAGVNLRTVERPPELAAYAGALDALGVHLEPEPLLARFVERLEERLEHLVRVGPAPLLEAWEARAIGLGEEVELHTAERLVRGSLAGLDPRGGVLIGGEAFHGGELLLPGAPRRNG